MRAVIEKHGNKHGVGNLYFYIILYSNGILDLGPQGHSYTSENKSVPPIRVIVADAKENEDIAIKVFLLYTFFLKANFNM